MVNGSHTPGPWELHHDNPLAVKSDSRRICICDEFNEKPWEGQYGVAEANARLIASSPTMANVLVELREVLACNADRYEVEIAAIDVTLEQAGIAKSRGAE